MNRKKTIRLNESQLKRVISEAVKRVLNEGALDQPPYYWSISELKRSGGEWECYKCVEDSATSYDAEQNKFESPEEAYNDG